MLCSKAPWSVVLKTHSAQVDRHALPATPADQCPVPQGVAREEPPGAPYCTLTQASHPGLEVSPVQTFPQHIPPGCDHVDLSQAASCP